MRAEWLERRLNPPKQKEPQNQWKPSKGLSRSERRSLEEREKEREIERFKEKIYSNRDIIRSCRNHLGLLHGEELVRDVQQALRRWWGDWGDIYDFELPPAGDERGGQYVIGVFRHCDIKAQVGTRSLTDYERRNYTNSQSSVPSGSMGVDAKVGGVEGIGITTYAGKSWICYSEPFHIKTRGYINDLKRLRDGSSAGTNPIGMRWDDPATNLRLKDKIGNLDIQQREIMDGLAKGVRDARRNRVNW